MKIILYRDGAPGVAAKLPGDNADAELEELLGGETEAAALNGRLKLVSLLGGEEKRLPIRYVVHRLGRAPVPIAGPCAIIGIGVDGRVRDISVQDIAAAECYIRSASARGGNTKGGCGIGGIWFWPGWRPSFF